MPEILNQLQELVVSICDRLYAERQLITRQSVKNMLQTYGTWDALDCTSHQVELDEKLTGYINDWRLHNLQINVDQGGDDTLAALEAQLCRYKADLFNAEQTINQLKAELLSRTQELKNLRLNMIQQLRGLLDG